MMTHYSWVILSVLNIYLDLASSAWRRSSIWTRSCFSRFRLDSNWSRSRIDFNFSSSSSSLETINELSNISKQISPLTLRAQFHLDQFRVYLFLKALPISYFLQFWQGWQEYVQNYTNQNRSRYLTKTIPKLFMRLIT